MARFTLIGSSMKPHESVSKPHAFRLTTTSIWEATANPSPVFPALSKSLRTDVVIVGGGISGLTCALHLAEAGKNIVLIEADRIGGGTTGRSTGNLYSIVDQGLSSLARSWGTNTTRKVVEARTSAVRFIERTISENGIACDFARVPLYRFTEEGSAPSKSFLVDERDASLRCGLSAELIDGGPLSFMSGKTLRLEQQAQFHPLKYVRGLAHVLSAKCEIFEKSPALEIDSAKGIVRCAGGEIQADCVVIATHVPKGVQPVIQMRLSPIREQAVAAKVRESIDPGIYWKIDQPKRSIRTVKDGDSQYALVIGDSFKTGHGDPEEDLEAIESYASSHFTLDDHFYYWGAQSYRPADGLPFIGRQDNRSFILTGFSADGLVYGTLGAAIIADALLERRNQWSGLFPPKRFTPLRSLPSMTKEGAENTCEYVRNLPGVGTTSLDEIAEGCGAIISHEGKKVAAFRDEAGILHGVSAVCTHMKCIVRFNPVERSWDCPCHASRFAIDGRVIEGPALQALDAVHLPSEKTKVP
jgi:glycine/D-amino acid oxidase-like deaminating enzyme/nitrite reductase/ring-hydroxylating ferredoxin subunit